MTLKFFNLNQKGMSLVETLVAIGVMAIFMAIFAQSQANQSKQNKMLSEKLALLDLEKVLIGALSQGQTCTYALTEPNPILINLNALSPSTELRIPVNRPIPASILSSGLPGPSVAEIGENISPDPSSPVLRQVNLVITEGTGGSYRGYWEFLMDQEKMTGRFKPVRVSAILNLDVTNPAAAFVTSCQGDIPSAVPTVTRRQDVVVAWRWPTATALCQSDEYLLSGGGVCNAVNGWMFIYQSEPLKDNTGWHIRCDTPEHKMATATAWAMCAKK